MAFAINYYDTAWMCIGTAVDGLVTFAVRPTAPQYPNIITTLFLGGFTLAAAYTGLSQSDPAAPYTLERAVAAFLLGFGVSQVISYTLPKITGGETAIMVPPQLPRY